MDRSTPPESDDGTEWLGQGPPTYASGKQEN